MTPCATRWSASMAVNRSFSKSCQDGAIGFSDWIDFADKDGRWWISQIIEERSNGRNGLARRNSV